MRKLLKILLIFGFWGICYPAFSASCDLKANEHFRDEWSRARSQTKTWTTVWGVTWSTATAAQLGIAVSTSQVSLRQDLLVGAVSSSLGLIPTWIVPPRITTDAPLELCANESEWNARLDRYAQDDWQYASFPAHLSNVAVNIAISLAMGAGFGHWESAALSSAVGIPIGEWMILSYPKASSKLRPMLSVSFTPVPGGGWIAVSSNGLH